MTASFKQQVYWAAAMAWMALLLAATVATAAVLPPQKLTRFPENTQNGNAAGQLDNPAALGLNQTTGHIYVAEEGNRVSEFTAWGEYVDTWGWGVADGSPELQVCGTASQPACQEGLAGSGAGQMSRPSGLAVDPSGNVYLQERENFRVQKFSPGGEFVLMFGKEVNKTTGAGICTAASGDQCGIGLPGAGGGEFGPTPQFNTGYIAAGSDGSVYVGDADRIEKFDPAGAFSDQIPLPHSGFPGSVAYAWKSGDLYMAFASTEDVSKPLVYRLDSATGKVVEEVPVQAPLLGRIGSLATDFDGNVFVNFDGAGFGEAENEPRVFEYDEKGSELLGFDAAFATPPTSQSIDSIGLGATAASPIGDFYVAEASALGYRAITAYGPPPLAFGPPPAKPPAIRDQLATSVGVHGAVLKAKINPRFWSDTSYYLEYGSQPCSAGGCAKAPAPPGRQLSTQVVDFDVLTEGINLSALSASTTYHYRFVAQSSGGGPTVGLSGKAGEEAESTFTTLPVESQQPPCPANAAVRPGIAAALPDCRAYEMVSPTDKNGADIETVFNSNGFPAALNQAGSGGDSITYSAYRAFGDVESSPYTSQYIATRSSSGWSSRGISPPREGSSLYTTGQLDSQYKGFTADLCQGWVIQDTDQPLGDGWVEGSPTVYRRDLCPSGKYGAVAPLRSPTVSQSFEFLPELQGFSASGSVALIQANGKLANNATVARQLYEAVNGQLRLVCILPSKSAVSGPCSAGAGGSTQRPARAGNLQHAISEDGTKIYWTQSEEGPGKLYVRIDHAETVAVSESTNAHFWGAAADGAAAVYSTGDELKRFSLADEASVKIAGGFKGILGISADARRVYFASTEAIIDSGVNSEGDEAEAGEPNLYVYADEEPTQFIATLTEADVEQNRFPSATASLPIKHMASVAPNGAAVAFPSTANLTGYDNRDVDSGSPAMEVYVYRADTNRLTCVSCLPTGQRPAARNLTLGPLIAARLPVAESQLQAPRVLSDSGDRLFFESFDPLSPRDINGQQDVYQWETTGAGNCTGSSPGFNPAFDGCVNLISSGDSPVGSEIVDSSPDGHDIFFKTESSLVAQDPAQVDIYDAREGGGFAPPPQPAPECQGEGCQPAGQAPTVAAPPSETYEGPGNQEAKKPTRGCPKGKHKIKRGGKRVCVKNKKKNSRQPSHGSHREGHR